jgi:N-acetylglutamate synthase-like GNAT family acetyltransferase
MQIHVWQAREVMPRARDFYARHGRDGGIGPEDILVVAEEGGEWLGVVRLCFEEGHYLLRTMQVLPERQGKLIGSQILKRFARLADESVVEEIHLIAFGHLERFYGQIGFKKVEAGPGFLMARLAMVAKKSPDKKHILMKWERGGR